MKRKKLPRAIIRTGSAMIFCSIITGTMWAQGIPSVTNIPNAQYPMVNPDRTVTFKVKAPDAKSVQIVLDRPYEMQKGQDGTWELTSSPQVPGFHYYFLEIDGCSVLRDEPPGKCLRSARGKNRFLLTAERGTARSSPFPQILLESMRRMAQNVRIYPCRV